MQWPTHSQWSLRQPSPLPLNSSQLLARVPHGPGPGTPHTHHGFLSFQQLTVAASGCPSNTAAAAASAASPCSLLTPASSRDGPHGSATRVAPRLKTPPESCRPRAVRNPIETTGPRDRVPPQSPISESIGRALRPCLSHAQSRPHETSSHTRMTSRAYKCQCVSAVSTAVPVSRPGLFRKA